MAEGQTEEIRNICDDILESNLRIEETLRKLLSELKISGKYAYDAVLESSGPKVYRWELDGDMLKKRREEALEKHRIDYENRTGKKSELTHSAEGYDEIDSKRLE